MKRSQLIILLVIVVVGALLRLFLLDTIPPGFNQDEASIGYNAYSILKTGKDEYGKAFPVYFKAFGDQKLPDYIYATAVSETMFGINEFAVRFPSAFFGILSLPLIYLLTYEFSKKNSLALLTTGLVAVNPWSLHYNRSAFEVSISLFLFLAGTLCLHYSFAKKVRGAFLLGAIFFILSLYSYNLTRLLSPVIFFFEYFWFQKFYKRQKRTESIITVIVSAILLIPFVASFLSSAGVSSAGGTLIFSSARFQAPLIEFRTTLISLPAIIPKLFFNTPILVLFEYLKNIASYFSVPFLFLVGEDHGNHGIGNVGQFYLFEFPLMIAGIWQVVKMRDKTGQFFLFWGAITIAIASLTREAPQATRSFFLVLPLEYFSAFGLYYFFKKWLQLSQTIRYAVVIVVCTCIAYNFIYYFASYYYRFPLLYAKAWRSSDKEVSYYINDHPEYEHIVFDNDAGFSYASLLFFNEYPPENFQLTAIRLPDDSEGFSKVIKFGKVSFLTIHSKDDIPENSLVILPPQKTVEGLSKLETVYYPQRTVVSADGQNILQYPTREEAYTLYEIR